MTVVDVLAFLERPVASDYGLRLSRLRWKRAVGARECVCLSPGDPARERIRGGGLWVLVADDAAIALGGPAGEPSPGRILAAASMGHPPPVHTMRELEEADKTAAAAEAGLAPCALCFRPLEHPPVGEESVAAYLARLSAARDRHELDPGLAGLALEDPSGRERPELSRRIPAGASRLLDVGCGAGGTSAAVKSRLPSPVVTGIERDSAAAARARSLLDRVLEGEAIGVLESLASAGESFDAFLFGDVLEHLEDPVRALSLARRIALSGATLVASVPNVGHLSLVRDLALGRFDPTPAGLADVGHLRWFDRRLLVEALEETGWRVVSFQGEGGAPAPRAEEFLAHFASWSGLDRESLMTYQWIAVAVAESRDVRGVTFYVGGDDDGARA